MTEEQTDVCELREQIERLQAAAMLRHEHDKSRLRVRDEALHMRHGLEQMIDLSASTPKQKALMRQALAHLWVRVDVAIGKVL